MDKEKLIVNFNNHLEQLRNEYGDYSILSEFVKCFKKLETTHTFAHSIVTENGDEIYPYIDIFFNHGSLLSHEYRLRNGIKNTKQPTERDLKFNLDKTVFAYLGSHDSYYGGKDYCPSFGVFISKNLEKNVLTNSSRRDLDSKEIKEPFDEEFLLPNDARVLIAHEITTRHNNNIWYYWGDPTYANSIKGYYRNMWEWKAEFHFPDKIDFSDINGVIWPNINLLVEDGVDLSLYLEEKRAFAKQYPHINIYEYEWTNKLGIYAFLNASHYVSKYYFENNKYPKSCKISYG